MTEFAKEALTFDDVQITPRYSEVESREDADLTTKLTVKKSLRLPLIASPMDTVCELKMADALAEAGGLGVLHRFMPIEKQVMAAMTVLRAGTEHDIVAAAVGVNGESRERAMALLKAGVNILVIDVAHGFHKNVKKMIEWLKPLKDEYDFEIVAGSIATKVAAEFLQDWGADALRVGVGGGSVCETRIRTGIGVPQLESVLEAVSVAKVPVISDGGIRFPGDVAKALAAGADSVMIGSLFAGTDEAPGEYFIDGEWPYTKKMKIYRGLASATTKMMYAGAASHVEGASKMIESRGPVSRMISDLTDGVTSSMSYVGAKNLSEFRTQSRFIRITPSGLAEAHPHLLR